MGMFTKIASDAFDALQTNAGVLLTAFDPENPYVTPTDAVILATTTGGINPTCEPTYTDYGEDVDNVPANMMEFKQLDGWNCAFAFTSIKFNAANTVWALGAAKTSTLANGVTKIVPRRNVKLSDFRDLWWVGDKASGGAYAIKLKNALSTGGLNIQSTKNGKGTSQVTVTGHVSINDQDTMPMEFYDIPAPLKTVTVTSAAGTAVGDTAITVSGYTLGTGESWKYAVGDYPEDVEYEQVLSGTEWTSWNGSTDITAATGKIITVAAVTTADSKAVAAGSTVVTAKAG